MTACPLCGGALAAWRSAPSSEPGAPGEHALLRCVSCGSAVTAGAAPVEAHEAGAYRPGRPRGARLAAPLLALFDRQRLGFLRRWAPPPGPLLDVGAGRGRFVASARAAGYEADGIEPSRRGVDGARETYGIALAAAGIEDATVAPASRRAVTLWHVLEHLDEPVPALERVAGWLAPGGVLLVGVPNLASWQARLGGRRWYHLDLPRHRIHCTPAGLRAAVAAAGLEVVAEHHVLLEHNPFGMWQSLVSRVTRNPSYLYNLLKRNAPLRSPDLLVTLLALPLVPLAVLLELAAGLAGHGGTLALVARRPGEAPGLTPA